MHVPRDIFFREQNRVVTLLKSMLSKNLIIISELKTNSAAAQAGTLEKSVRDKGKLFSSW